MAVQDLAKFDVLMPMAPWEEPAIVSMALESLEKQILQPSKVIISCDGPPPDSLRSVIAACRLPVQVIEGPGREGVGPVLARGMDYCQADLIIRADADDISSPDRCLIQVRTMCQFPGIVAMSTWIEEFQGDPSEITSVRKVPIGTAKTRQFSRWRNPLNHPAVILRRSIVNRVGGYRSCPGFEDYYLWLRLLKQGYIIDNIADPLVKARVGPDHTARRNGWSYLKAEGRFLWRCAHEELLEWPHAIGLALLRLPVRLVPVPVQTWIMRTLLRGSSNQGSAGHP